MENETMKCDDCGEVFEKRNFYTDVNGTCICKYCYDGNYTTNENNEIIENKFEL